MPVAALAEARLRPGAVVTVEAGGPRLIVVRAVDDELDDFVGALPEFWPADALDRLRDEWA